MAPAVVADHPAVTNMIDRLQILFGRPAMITEGRGFAATITSEALPVDVLKG